MGGSAPIAYITISYLRERYSEEINADFHGKEQTMRCVDCELHDCVVGTHFCNYKGKSGRRKPRRISEEDAHKDVPCEFVEGAKGVDDEYR